MLADRLTTTSRRNEMTSGRHSERMTKGREGGATRGDTTTSLRDEMMIGWCNERMTKQWEGSATRGWDSGATRGDPIPDGAMRQQDGGASRGWRTRGDVTTSQHNEKMRGWCDERTARWQATQQLARGEILRQKRRRCDEMMRCSTRGLIFERGAKERCDVWQAQCWTAK